MCTHKNTLFKMMTRLIWSQSNRFEKTVSGGTDNQPKTPLNKQMFLY